MLPGFREGMRNVSLDEQRHIAFGVRSLADLYARTPRSSRTRSSRRSARRCRGHPAWPPGRRGHGTTPSFGFALSELLRGRALARDRGCAGDRPDARRDPALPVPDGPAAAERAERGLKLLKADLLGPENARSVRDPEADRDHDGHDAPPAGTRRRPARDDDPVGLHGLRALVPDARPTGHGRQAGHAPSTPDVRLRLGFDDWVDVVAGREDARKLCSSGACARAASCACS